MRLFRAHCGLYSRVRELSAVLAVAVCFCEVLVRGDEPLYTKHTYTYKTVGRCKIHLDTYRMPGDDIRPVILYIHGGALISGHRSQISDSQFYREELNRFLAAGFALVSIDYRLAPESKLKSIMEDVRDAHRWLRSKGLGLLRIDPDRIVVIGHSAGGYLTLMSGFCLNPRPQALVAFYGYGDIASPWVTRADGFADSYSLREPPVSKEEAYQAVDGPVLSEGSDNRFQFCLYCRQNGLWAKEVTGYDPGRAPRAFDAFCPVRNITKAYPPTMLLHGTRDDDVPYDQSVQVAEELKRRNVEHTLITIANGEHGFDCGTNWLAAPANSAILNRVVEFLKDHAR